MGHGRGRGLGADDGCCGAAAWPYAASATNTHAPPVAISALFFTNCPVSRKLRRRQTGYESLNFQNTTTLGIING